MCKSITILSRFYHDSITILSYNYSFFFFPMPAIFDKAFKSNFSNIADA